MPLYEYKCTECGEITDASKPIKDRSKPVECRLCGESAEYILSVPTYRFIGDFPGESLKKKVDYGGTKRRGKVIKTI